MPKNGPLVGSPLFAITVFASAFLIFLVQPMVGKHILPWFGGAPGVWTLCLAFYQTTLFIGYAYAHLLIRFIPVNRQIIIHGVVLLCAFGVLPVLPDADWKPLGPVAPAGRILAMLCSNVALPFLMLASTGPLVQAWFARRYPAASPYPLYALSNVGSLLALFSFPFLFEPLLPLPVTSQLWSLGFTFVGFAVLACAVLANSASHANREVTRDEAEAGGETEVSSAGIALWMGLPACAVVLLMGVTNKLCLDIANVPFLWIVPLATYLLTFILCFSSERLFSRSFFVALLVLSVFTQINSSTFLLGPESWNSAVNTLWGQVILYNTTLFASCMLMHGDLYRLRPRASSLTAFYLCVSAGGASGGIFVGIVAPLIFDAYHELPLGIAVCWLLVLVNCYREQRPGAISGGRRWAWAATGLATLAVFGGVAKDQSESSEDLIYQARNFYGILRVFERKDDDSGRHLRVLMNGTTKHGTQIVRPGLSLLPTTYFGRATGIGYLLRSRIAGESQEVGIIGLGIGTLAAYGRAGDTFRFYEIDPDVIRIARDHGMFTYLRDSDADIEVVEGDARIALTAEFEKGRPRQKFDILILDAFSSDSVPIHLLTREAFALYADHLAANGTIALHISSRYLKLTQLAFRLGESAGFDAIEVLNRVSPRYQSIRSKWVFFSRDPHNLVLLGDYIDSQREALGLNESSIRIRKPRANIVAKAPLWTDQYSNLFGIVK